MFGHIALEDSPPTMRNDEEAVENAEGERRYGEEIHRCNRLTMVGQKRRPSLCRFRIPRRFLHPPQHSSLREIEAKHLQFTVNARRSPVEFSVTMRKMSSRNSLLTHFLPTRIRCREIQVQYNLSPARCQRTTASGCTRINARRQPAQSRSSITQNNRSEAENRGCGCRRPKTETCCRRARFSSSKSRRERENRVKTTTRSLSRRSIGPV
jgi:hypothetical protein